MERKEYLLSELPIELRPLYDAGIYGFPVDCMGFTLGGVRYRIYRDERNRESAKALGIDLKDAIKGADVPAEQVEAAMDRLGYDPEMRRETWAAIAEQQARSIFLESPSLRSTTG